MKKITLLMAGLALGSTMVLLPSASKATIIGGSHDFTSTGGYSTAGTNGVARFKWGGSPGGTDPNSYYENPCQVCHIPHKSQNYTTAKAPLWNHSLSSSTYVTYDANNSATYKGGSITLGSSIACLSCHDGSVAINQTAGYTGAKATNSLNGQAVFAPSFSVETVGGASDLRNMHPIGVSYSACVANGDTDLQPIDTLLGKMLKGTDQTVECASCHDIHETMGNAGLDPYDHGLIVTLDNGALCLKCHKK